MEYIRVIAAVMGSALDVLHRGESSSLFNVRKGCVVGDGSWSLSSTHISYV